MHLFPAARGITRFYFRPTLPRGIISPVVIKGSESHGTNFKEDYPGHQRPRLTADPPRQRQYYDRRSQTNWFSPRGANRQVAHCKTGRRKGTLTASGVPPEIYQGKRIFPSTSYLLSSAILKVPGVKARERTTSQFERPTRPFGEGLSYPAVLGIPVEGRFFRYDCSSILTACSSCGLSSGRSIPRNINGSEGRWQRYTSNQRARIQNLTTFSSNPGRRRFRTQRQQ